MSFLGSTPYGGSNFLNGGSQFEVLINTLLVNSNFYTKAESDNRYLVKSGGGALNLNDTPLIAQTISTDTLTANNNVIVRGDLIVEGKEVVLDTEQLRVEDGLIELAKNNIMDSMPIGFVGKYVLNGATRYAGLMRNPDTPDFILLNNFTTIPTTQIANTSLSGGLLSNLRLNTLNSLSIANTGLISTNNLSSQIGTINTLNGTTISITNNMSSGSVNTGVITTENLTSNDITSVSGTFSGNLTVSGTATVGTVSTTAITDLQTINGQPLATFQQSSTLSAPVVINNTDNTAISSININAIGRSMRIVGTGTNVAGQLPTEPATYVNSLGLYSRAIGQDVRMVSNQGVFRFFSNYTTGSSTTAGDIFRVNINGSLETTNSSNQFLLNKIGDASSSSRILYQQGGSLGAEPATPSTDGGLYSRSANIWMRFVNNNAPFKFFSNYNNGAGVGSTPTLTIEPDGRVIGTNSFTATQFITSSDVRIKENIQPYTKGLETLENINIKTYNLIDDDNKTTHVGVIAQEIETIIPEAVNIYDNGQITDLRSVSYDVIFSIAVNSVKQLNNTVKQQQTAIDNLLSTINSLTARIEALEQST